jgi:hypothetical protein
VPVVTLFMAILLSFAFSESSLSWEIETTASMLMFVSSL